MTVPGWTITPLSYTTSRIVMFGSYGTFEDYRPYKRTGTSKELKEENIIGLLSVDKRPGMLLTRDEFDEMVAGTMAGRLADFVWEMSSGHIGVTRLMLEYVESQIKDKAHIDVSVSRIEQALRSKALIEAVGRERGVPSSARVAMICEQLKLSDKETKDVYSCLDRVARVENNKYPATTGSPGKNRAVETLVKNGLLFVLDDQLEFASQMHLKAWLLSTRTNPSDHLLDPFHDEFLFDVIRRMRSKVLQEMAKQNGNQIVRERQMQMELYHALAKSVSTKYLITPEYYCAAGNGYVDIVIQGGEVSWFWELLVDGIESNNHMRRFQPGGKYFDAACDVKAKWAVIDLRQSVDIRDFKENMTYVVFKHDYSEAKVIVCGLKGIVVESRMVVLEGV